MFRKFVVLALLSLLAAWPAQAQVPFTNYQTTPAPAGSLIVCPGSACNLYSWNVTSGAAAGFLLLIDSLTVPADGAVVPKLCIPVAANSGIAMEYNTSIRFTTGLVAVYSTTGCYTKTISATAFISVGAQ